MNWKTSFVRKISYITAMVLLLFPLFLLGQPETQSKAGGKLSQLRTAYGLSQAELGDIDPVGASMQLATFGMRGVAAAVLWEKATQYKKTEDWDNLTATLNQITKLQPNFLSVWKFQAHNLSYNISSEFDDYRHRYHWVKKGISFLVTGTKYNRHQPKLLMEVGRYTGQKIGRSDEHVQFREMFRDDKLFHDSFADHVDATRAMGAMGKPDNWLVARMWYAEAEVAVEKEGMPFVGTSSVIFFMSNPFALIQYAMAIEDEGILDEKGREAFRRAGQQWKAFGNRELEGPYGGRIRLNDVAVHRQASAEYLARISELSPGLEEKIYNEKLARLDASSREALDTPAESRSKLQQELAGIAMQDLEIMPQELAERVPSESRKKAMRLAELAARRDKLARETEYSKGNVNYEYWRTRCRIEQTRLATNARKAVRDANLNYRSGDPLSARKKFEEAWDLWYSLFEKNPSMWKSETAEALMPDIQSYFECLEQLDVDRPRDFKLVRLLQQYELNANARPTDVKSLFPSLSEEENPNQ